MIKNIIFLNVVVLLLAFNMNAQEIPTCEKIPHQITAHKDTRIDNYYWLNDYWLNGSKKEQVLDYLKRENSYSDAIMEPTKELQDLLYNEIKGRIKETDQSVPYFENGYWYIVRTEESKEYPIYTRRKGNMEAPEEILLDVSLMADGHGYYQVGSLDISPDNKIMAYGVDTLGRRQYTIYFKNLETGQLYDATIPNTTSNLVWAQDSKTVFYSTQNAKTLRSNKIWRYEIGMAKSKKLIFTEKDEMFDVSVSKTKSNQYIFINSESTLSSETQFILASQPLSRFQIFLPREKEILYSIEDFEGDFYILTNWEAFNFRLMKVGINGSYLKDNWKEIIPHRKDVLLESFDIFKDYLVIQEVANVNTQIKVIPWKNQQKGYYIHFDTDAYMAGLGYNPEFETNKLRFHYQSMNTPPTQFELQMDNQQRTVLKQKEVMGDFHSEYYVTKRIWATAKDGTKVPISIIYRKDFKNDGTHPLLLNGYGAYGLSSDPYFSVARFSLLDRGFAIAIAHIRGGEEMGRQWYEDGKMFKKMNTFTDFIDCADFLIEEGYTSKEHLYANGGSAGGLLMGAVANLRPDLWNGIVSDVPFVDVLTTMLDKTIPLTVGEYDEWGNPHNKASYFYIKSYSPYDNIERKSYPHMMINTGLHDSQVQYFEPAKYVAKLRELKTDDNILILNCDMETGHGGKSGRFQKIFEIAREYAFYLMLEKLETPPLKE
ncbi:MAG: S9 family peptidase [Chitinophagales bacterium]|nr:S9 family peptidase [Chitinophagales bacterium]